MSRDYLRDGEISSRRIVSLHISRWLEGCESAVRQVSFLMRLMEFAGERFCVCSLVCGLVGGLAGGSAGGSVGNFFVRAAQWAAQ